MSERDIKVKLAAAKSAAGNASCPVREVSDDGSGKSLAG